MIAAVCPECGLRADLDVFVSSGDDARALAVALELPAPLARPIIGYLRLFAPPRRALSARKRERLLTELRDLIRAGEIQRKGRSWPAPVDYWRHALEAVIEQRDKLQLPLSGHGYLLEIICGVALRAEHRAEVEHEKRRCANAPRRGTAKPVAAVVRAKPPPGWKEQALGKRGKIQPDETPDQSTDLEES